jgi:hypothetical protein
MNASALKSIGFAFVVMTGPAAVAQTGHFARWEVSLDNGATWQQGAVSAPQSQASAIVRMRWQHWTNGSVTPIEQRVNILDAAAFEAYSTTAFPNADTATNLQQMFLVPPSDARLFATPIIASRRVGNVLAIDRFGDTAPLGGNLGVLVTNRVGGAATQELEQDFPLLQYTLNLDGTSGDRVLSGLFLPFDTGRPFTPGFDQISAASQFAFFAADITHLPTTLTIIPAPGSVLVVCGTAMFALRRCRRVR